MATSPPASGVPPQVPDHELIHCIGRGSYGEVWLARNKLGTMRAVKVVHRAAFEDARPFEREFKGIQKFEPISRSHEGLVDILQVGGAAEYFYYVMELADDVNSSTPVGTRSTASDSSRKIRDGVESVPTTPKPESGRSLLASAAAYSPKTLGSDLKRRSCLPLDECIALGLALTRALAYLHGQGLIHRDIKPSNIIFVGGVPKLADVGLVAGVGEAHSYVGTEGFIPPEGPGSPQADLYGLGIVLYVMSTGKNHEDFPEPLPDLAAQPDHPRWLEFNAVIHKACAADPRERYRHAEAVQADLALLQRGHSVKQRRLKKRRLSIAKRILLAAAILTLLTVVAVTLSRKPGRTDASIRSPASQRQQAENPDVSMLCKLGRFHYLKITEEGFAKGMESFNRALEIDPRSVLAYAGIADLCVCSQPSRFLPPKAAEARMRWVRDKLMGVDSQLAEGHAVQGYIHLAYDWNPTAAEKELNLALELDPDLLITHIWRGRFFAFTRKFDEAEQEYQKARQLDPARYGLHVHLGLPSFFGRRYDRAIEFFEKAIEVVPSLNWGITMIGRANEEKGNYPAAIEAFQKAELAQGGQPEAVKQKYDKLRAAYEASARDGYWRKKLEFSRDESGGSLAWFDALEIAQIHAHLGDDDRAFAWLDKAFQEKSEYLLWLNVDPGWDNIRSDPRFIALLKKMGLAQ